MMLNITRLASVTGNGKGGIRQKSNLMSWFTRYRRTVDSLWLRHECISRPRLPRLFPERSRQKPINRPFKHWQETPFFPHRIAAEDDPIFRYCRDFSGEKESSSTITILFTHEKMFLELYNAIRDDIVMNWADSSNTHHGHTKRSRPLL